MSKRKNDFIFYRNFTVLFIIVSGLLYLLKNKNNPILIHPNVWLIQVFFLVIILVSFKILSSGLRKDPLSFHIYLMGSMAVRFVFSAFFMLFCLYFSPIQHMLFAINFFILYLVYTGFEIYFILCNLQADSKKDGKVA